MTRSGVGMLAGFLGPMSSTSAEACKSAHLRHGATMRNPRRAGAGIIAGICLSLAFGSPVFTQTQAPRPSSVQKESVMTTRATGTFEVKLNPQAPDDKAAGATLGRMSIDKQFHGDLEATSRGEML